MYGHLQQLWLQPRLPSMSPTVRTLQRLREEGYTVQVVEHYNKFARRRIDLFNVIDIVAIKADKKGVFGIQTTTSSHISSRRKKALGTPELLTWLRAGNLFEIWGWALRGPRGKRKTYQLRAVRLTVSDFSDTLSKSSEPSTD